MIVYVDKYLLINIFYLFLRDNDPKWAFWNNLVSIKIN